MREISPSADGRKSWKSHRRLGGSRGNNRGGFPASPRAVRYVISAAKATAEVKARAGRIGREKENTPR